VKNELRPCVNVETFSFITSTMVIVCEQSPKPPLTVAHLGKIYLVCRYQGESTSKKAGKSFKVNLMHRFIFGRLTNSPSILHAHLKTTERHVRVKNSSWYCHSISDEDFEFFNIDTLSRSCHLRRSQACSWNFHVSVSMRVSKVLTYSIIWKD